MLVFLAALSTNRTYLGVELSAVVVAGAVQRNDLVAEDVVSGLEVAGDGQRRGELVGNQVIRDPVSVAASLEKATLRDLGPAKGRGGQRRAVAYYPY